MAEQVGYAILDLRIKTLEEELKTVKADLKEHVSENRDEFKEINERVDDLATITTEVKIMFANLTKNQNEMKQDIKEIAASAGKDQGWRALLTDLIKGFILLAGFIGGGKWFG